MAINETIVTGRKFRKLIDEATKQWQRISFWTKANDVEFDDGTNAETKFGAVSGITDSLTSTSSNVAASAAAVKALNDKITKLNSELPLTINSVSLQRGENVTITNKWKKVTFTATIAGYNSGDTAHPYSFYVQGSQNASNWTNLYERVNNSASAVQISEQVVNISGYKYVRLMSNSYYTCTTAKNIAFN